jgi:hypothetical protein
MQEFGSVIGGGKSSPLLQQTAATNTPPAIKLSKEQLAYLCSIYLTPNTIL